ncbi:acyltransferase family protein [Microbacterium sp. BDGP8]|uniref:acyltransferase family protein n=1 Tax=unclassified Microbacterium TaxID=2609290 RepID=UPI00249D8CCC|nr:acyltransferase family protein [Microbacterium sp. BDGP8]WHE35489.1 acyltransferase family protein [Microbacterium sp. BDGP8]
MTGLGPASARPRQDWVDIAKALAILLIVVYHVTTWFAGYVAPWVFEHRSFIVWRELSRVLVPVRIPLFFLVSGLLAQRAITRPWGDLWRSRFATPLWVFAIWTCLIAAPWSFRAAPGDPAGHLPMVVQSLLLAGTHFWYLPALVVYIAVAKVAVGRPRWALGASALATFVVGPLLVGHLDVLGPVLGPNVERLFLFAVWFCLGCFAPSLVQRVSTLRYRWLIVAGAVFAFAWTLVPLGWLAQRVVVPTITIAGIVALVLISRILERAAVVRTWGRYLARRTLPIYVVHAFLLEVLALVMTRLPIGASPGLALPVGSWTAALFVPVTFALVVAASLALDAVAPRIGARWLFTAPRLVAGSVAVKM